MARVNNLSNFLNDVADAIRTKKETTEQIPAANFDSEILDITTGVMTEEEYNRCETVSNIILGETKPYTELEYIESTGTQYINTGVVFPSSGGKAIIDFCYTNDIMDVYICGTNQQFEAGKDERIAFYSGSGFTYSQTSDMYARTIATGNNTGSNRDNIFLFARNWPRLYRPCAMKFYSAKFYNANNELVRDFIPVKRKSDNIICLYDKVSKQYFTNQGTGNFIAGGVV